MNMHSQGEITIMFLGPNGFKLRENHSFHSLVVDYRDSESLILTISKFPSTESFHLSWSFFSSYRIYRIPEFLFSGLNF